MGWSSDDRFGGLGVVDAIMRVQESNRASLSPTKDFTGFKVWVGVNKSLRTRVQVSQRGKVQVAF